jgi:hypothetical protein
MGMCSNCDVFNSSWDAKKDVTSKCDAYDKTDSVRRLVVPRPRNLWEKFGTSRFWSRPRNLWEKPKTSRLWQQPVLTINIGKTYHK